jgi:hypothetical protein
MKKWGEIIGAILDILGEILGALGDLDFGD